MNLGYHFKKKRDLLYKMVIERENVTRELILYTSLLLEALNENQIFNQHYGNRSK